MPKKKMGKPIAAIAEPTVESRQKHVLVAILGTSPAVLTEAVWALAMRKNIVPDKIVVLTTTEGHDKFFKDVCDKHEHRWRNLCADLNEAGKAIDEKIIGHASFKIFPNENNDFADDLRSYGANMLAADMMVEELVRFNKGKEWVIHGLIAGGRKTMTALFFSCMCLLARKGDKVYHVLGPEKDPDFYYPHTPSEADKVNLFSVPFVRIGRWTEEMEKKCLSEGKSLTYQNLIQVVERELDTALSKKREGAGGRSSLRGEEVTSIFKVADDGKKIICGNKEYKITHKKAWEIIDRLLRAAKSKNGGGWIKCDGSDLNCFRAHDANRFRFKWIETDSASGSKAICRARLKTSLQGK